MNERDVKLAEFLSAEIGAEESGAIYLISVKYTNLVRLNLVILKALLEQKRKKGMMITIDRPHQYVSHLLQLHHIDQSNLSFVDAISVHSSDNKDGGDAVHFSKGPFHIESLPEFIADPSGIEPEDASQLEHSEFIVLDNISTLLTYNTMDSVEEFFGRYLEVLKSKPSQHTITVLAMDKEIHPKLFSFVANVASKTIELSPDMQIEHIFESSPDGPVEVSHPKSVI